MLDLGTVKPGTTVYIPFHTFDSNDPSASVTITGLATTDIEVYKDGSATTRASDNGYALLDTDGTDFGGNTGIHGISVDLADNSDANFYEAGSQYWVVIASITVDAATVNFVAATFRIGYAGAVLDTTIATLASQTGFTLEDGSADNNAYVGCTAFIHDLASAVQVAIGYVTAYTGATKTVTLAADPGIFTMAAGDNISLFMPANVTAVGGTAQTAADIGSDVTAIESELIVVHSETTVIASDTLVIESDTTAIELDTGTDGVLLAATATSAQLVDDVWDEDLTAATHNVANSSGRRLRQLQESAAVYADGAIWIDTVNGTAGTADYENGTPVNPVDTIADANTLAASLGISRFRVASGSSITFAAAQTNQEFIGHEWTLALGGQNIAGSYFEGASVSGTGTGSNADFNYCGIGTTTLADCRMGWCRLEGTLTLSAAGDYYLHDCYSGVAGGGTEIIDFGAAVGNTALNMRRYSGGLTINNKDGTGTDTMSLEGNGQLVVAASSGGAISIRGNFQVTNTGGATITYDDNTAGIVNIYSDTTVIESDVAAIEVDTSTTLSAQITTIASDVVEIYSDTTVIESDVAAIEVDTSTTLSAQITTIASDVVEIYSDTTAIHSDTTIIASDVVVLDGAIILASGTADSGSTTTIVDAERTEADDDYWNGARVLFTSGTIAGQVREITDFDQATDTITFSPATTQAVSTNTYHIIQGVAASGLTAGQASDLAAIESELILVHSETTVIQSDTTVIESDVAAIEVDTSTTLSAQITTIASDVVEIYSDTTAIHSDTTIIASDVVVLDGAIILASGTADSGSTTTIVDAERTEADDDYWNGARVLITSGTSAGQVREITDFVAATDTITFSPALTQAITTNTYHIIQGVAASGLTAAQASDLAAIESELILVHSETTVIQSDTTVIESDVAAIEVDTSTTLSAQITTIASDVVEIYSDTTAIHSDTTIATSDTAVIESAVSDVESSLVIVKSDLVVATSDLAVIESAVSDIESSLVIVKSDLVVATSDLAVIESDTTAIHSDTTIVASDIALLESALVRSTAKAGTLSTTQMSTNLTEATDDHYIGRTIIWLSGDLAGQASDITDYVGVNGVLTFSEVTEAPSANDQFVIV